MHIGSVRPVQVTTVRCFAASREAVEPQHNR